MPDHIGLLAHNALGNIALTLSQAFPYNMGMKNTKAVFFIILGAFLMGTGFAFAAPEDSKTFDMLNNGFDFDTPRAGDIAVNKTPVVPGLPAITKSAPVKAAAAPAVKPTDDFSVTIKADNTPAKADEKKPPTTKEKVNKFLKGNMERMAACAIGAYVGFLLLGPIGLLFGAVAMFGFDYLANV